MQLLLRINKTSIRMNNWVIFFHFEMIGIKFALKLSQMCGIWSTLNIYGKYSHGAQLHYISLFTGFLQVKYTQCFS